jgi:hypothetical protein
MRLGDDSRMRIEFSHMTPLQKSRRRRGNEAQTSKKLEPSHVAPYDDEKLMTELLILPDGRILVHSLTQPFAELLAGLNPDCVQISSRVSRNAPNELPPPFSSLSSPEEAAGEASAENKLPPGRGEEANYFQTQIPSPQPSPRLGGERESHRESPVLRNRTAEGGGFTQP